MNKKFIYIFIFVTFFIGTASAFTINTTYAKVTGTTPLIGSNNTNGTYYNVEYWVDAKASAINENISDYKLDVNVYSVGVGNYTNGTYYNIVLFPEHHVNTQPVLKNVSVSDSFVLGGSTVIFTANSAYDYDFDTIYMYCSNETNPSSSNTLCTNSPKANATNGYSISCNITAPYDDEKHTYYCRLFDGIYYSYVFSDSFTSYSESSSIYSYSNSSIVAQNISILFYAKLTYPNGTPIADQILSWTDETDDVVIGSNTTNATGWAFYDYKIPDNVSIGDHVINVTFDGNDTITAPPGYNDTLVITVSSTPQIISYELTPTTGGWGETFNFSVNITDADGDYVNVSLFISTDNSTWSMENSTTLTASVNTQVSFLKNDFTCDDIGIWYYKINITDNEDGIDTTNGDSFTVEQDDITATVCESSRGQTVQTRGLTKINLTVRIYDADRGVYLDGVNGTIWVSMNNTATSWDGGHACVTTNGNCTIEFDPDCDYKGGTQYFIGGTTGNTCYKNANTTLDTSLDWIIIDATPECAYTVEIQLGFNISGPDSDIAVVGGKTGEGIYYGDNITRYYVCSYDTDIPGSPAFGLVFSGGKFYYIELENQTTQYLMKMSQELAGNKFIVPITPGTCARIESKMNLTPDFISGPFSAFVEQKAYPVLVTLSYPGIDIVGDEEFGQGQFTIVLEKNETGNITQIIVKRK